MNPFLGMWQAHKFVLELPVHAMLFDSLCAELLLVQRILEHEIKKDINQVVGNLVDFINKVRLSETSDSSTGTKDMLQYNSAKYDELSMLAAVESNEKRLDASEFINPLILGLSDEVPGQSFSVFN